MSWVISHAISAVKSETPHVIAEETADDPAITQAIRDHAREVTGFVRDGMPAMMRDMMGGGMMP